RCRSRHQARPALRARRSRAARAGGAESPRQCLRRRHRPACTARGHGARLRAGRLRRVGRTRYRNRRRPRRPRADLRAILYAQAQWDGHWPRDLPHHRRSARRTYLRAEQSGTRIRVRSHPTGDSGGRADRRGKVMNEDVTLCVVDDDEFVRNALLRLLRAAGYRACGYPSAQALLAQPWPANGTPTVVLTDLRMPGIDGIALAEQLATLP